MLLQQEQHVNKYHKSNNKNKFRKFRFKKKKTTSSPGLFPQKMGGAPPILCGKSPGDEVEKKSKPSRSPVMSFASNFQPPGTSDDRSFELIGALLWCSVTTSTGKHFWLNPRGGSRRSEPPKCNTQKAKFFLSLICTSICFQCSLDGKIPNVLHVLRQKNNINLRS